MSIKLSVIVLSLFIFSCSKTFEKNDLYVDKLVYLKSDSTLFSGTIKVEGESTYYSESFCQGVPCGEWAEFENNGMLVHKGKYFAKDILSKMTQKMIGTDTFLVNHWQEGPDVKYPQTLTVMILKENTFFNSKVADSGDNILQLAKAVRIDTRNLQYDYLSIKFVNAVHDWTKDYSKDYKLQDEQLIVD